MFYRFAKAFSLGELGSERLAAEDPGAGLELVSVVEFWVVGLAIEPHFMDDFEPTLG